MYRGERAAFDRESHGFRGGVAGIAFGGFALPGIHAVDEVTAPQFAWRHVHELLDVNGRKHGLVGAVRATVRTFHARALAVFDDEPRHRFVREDHATVGLDEARQRLGEFPRSAFGHGAAA